MPERVGPFAPFERAYFQLYMMYISQLYVMYIVELYYFGHKVMVC